MFVAFVCKDAKLKQSYLWDIGYIRGGTSSYALSFSSPTILCSGQKVRISVVSSEICNLRTVNLALSHSCYRTRMKFPRTIDGLVYSYLLMVSTVFARV